MSTDRPRGRGPTITREMKGAIRDIHLRHPEWPAKSFIESLKELFGWSPEERAIQNVRKRGMDNLKNETVFNLLRPWHLGKIDKYPIPLEAVPHVLKVKEWTENKFKRIGVLNVWQVKWIARLYNVPKIKNDTHVLWKVATAYAARELEYIFADIEIDTSDLDSLLIKPDVLMPDWNTFILNLGKRITEYIRNKKELDAIDWILEPEIFYGSKSWEELKTLYSEKEGGK